MILHKNTVFCNSKVVVVMVEPESKLLALKDGWASSETKEQQRLKALSELGLRQSETIPVFEEATQTAAHYLKATISILGFMDHEVHWFKSAVGLSRLGLFMNNLAQTRQILRRESFCRQVVENIEVLVINDTDKLTDPSLANSQLVQNYKIRSYLGVPLIDAAGNCLGSLAVMYLEPREFEKRDIEFLQITARWSMSEFERNRLLLGKTEKNTVKAYTSLPVTEDSVTNFKISATLLGKNSTSTKQIKLDLLSHLTQELRTPLTSVLGMASVLGREIYGPLTTKQREYVEIIQHSGKYLLSLVNEITELGAMDEGSNTLNLAPVDIEMLCQQAINTLEEVASRREQDIRLSIEPGRSRIWPLDKDKVRQILYHLIFSVIQISATGSIVRIHVSYKEDTLNITVWVSHPWLGDGIDFINPLPILDQLDEPREYNVHLENEQIGELAENLILNHAQTLVGGTSTSLTQVSNSMSRERLGLLLSCHLAELHGGQIITQGSSESGYRYVLSLPLQSPTTSEVVNDA